METLLLTKNAVKDTILDCLYDEGVIQKDDKGTPIIPKDAIYAEGIVRTFIFDPEKINKNKDKIASLLDCLPPEVKLGVSFLNLCNNKNGEIWGHHKDIEELLALGIAAEMAMECFPKELRESMPAGLPYYVVDTKGGLKIIIEAKRKAENDEASLV